MYTENIHLFLSDKLHIRLIAIPLAKNVSVHSKKDAWKRNCKSKQGTTFVIQTRYG